MKNKLRNWIVGIFSIGCILALVSCEGSGQSPMKQGGTPNVGAISATDGAEADKKKEAETPPSASAPSPAAETSAAQPAAGTAAPPAGTAGTPQK